MEHQRLELEYELYNKNPASCFGLSCEDKSIYQDDKWSWRIKNPSTGQILYYADRDFAEPSLATDNLYDFMKKHEINGWRRELNT